MEYGHETKRVYTSLLRDANHPNNPDNFTQPLTVYSPESPISTPSIMHTFSQSDTPEIEEDTQSVSESSTESTVDWVPLYDLLSSTEIEEAEEFMHAFFDEYVHMYALDMKSPKFREEMEAELALQLYTQWSECGICDSHHIAELEEWVHTQAELLFSVFPARSYVAGQPTPIVPEPNMESILATLTAYPQPKQRTSEWYAFRNNLITASSVWKVFGTESQRNSLIYEKCAAMAESGDTDDMHISSSHSLGAATGQNPMQWGAKYEPVSAAIYERRNATKLGEFGCIAHPQYPYLGASPDGINVDPTNPDKYGRMVEIKNIVNREITGEPLEAYWIQMQIQMEVCGLNACDFVETRFREFDGPDAFFDKSRCDTEKGIILYFLPKFRAGESAQSAAEYVYCPLELTLGEDFSAVYAWIRGETGARPHSILYHTVYWYLAEFSCVLVLRNPEWFAAAQPHIAELWQTVEKEREEGYDHRAAKRRAKPQTEVVCEDNTDTQYIRNLPKQRSVCLVKLEG